MPVYKYKARDKQGRSLTAAIEASDIKTAAQVLREKGLFIAEIKEPAKGLNSELSIPGLERGPGLKDVTLFSRMLATMLNAGLPIVQALAILENQTNNKPFRKIIKEIRTDLESGSSFSEALQRHKQFSRLYINLVRAGESSGNLDVILDRLSNFLEKDVALRSKLASGLKKPMFVMAFALLVTYFLLTTVVPKLADVLFGLGVGLPLVTKVLIAVANFLQRDAWILVVVGIASYVGYTFYYKTYNGRRVVDRIKLRMMIFGPLVQKGSIARFCRTFSLLLAGGVNIIEALDITKGTAGNAIVEDIVEETKNTVQIGEPLASTLQAYPIVFPPMVGSMVAIGEETGALDNMLAKVADFYEQEVDDLLNSLTEMIEPLITIFLGGIVALIVFAVFLPMFKIIGQLSGANAGNP